MHLSIIILESGFFLALLYLDQEVSVNIVFDFFWLTPFPNAWREKKFERQVAIHSFDEVFCRICFMNQKGQQPEIVMGYFMPH